jgi:hypothetical protein
MDDKIIIETLDGNIKVTSEQQKFIFKAFENQSITINHKLNRVILEDQNSDSYTIHVGSHDPYKGGGGITYKLDLKTGKVTEEYTETYAPDPTMEEE